MKTKITVTLLTLILALILCGAVSAEDSSDIIQNSSASGVLAVNDSSSGTVTSASGSDGPSTCPEDTTKVPDPWNTRTGATAFGPNGIQEVLDNATTMDGDTIMVEPGVYNQVIVNKRVTIMANATGVFVAGFIINGLSLNPFIGTNWVELNGFTITPTGIELNNVVGCRLINNTIINNNNNGIELLQSTMNHITNNTIIGTQGDSAIFLKDNSNTNNIIGNTIGTGATGNNHDGIRLDNCLNNVISGNTIQNNERAIMFIGSSGNQITGNQILDNHGYAAVYLQVSSNNTITGNNISNTNHPFNPADGIRLDNSGAETLPNILSGNNITGNKGNGINLFMSSYNKIDNSFAPNQITFNHNQGIRLDQSNGNRILGNIITDQDGTNGPGNGIDLAYSGTQFAPNTISGNIISRNNGNGINLFVSSYNIIDNSQGPNQITENHNNGISLSGDGGSNGNQIIGNNISSQLGTTGPGCGIFLTKSGNQINPNTITGNTITNNRGNGIELRNSNYNIISGNNQINNNKNNGIYLTQDFGPGAGTIGSNYNQIIGNTIQNNQNDGIRLETASHNTLNGNIVGNNGGAGVILELFLPPLNPGDPVPECRFNVINGNNVITCNTMDGIALFSHAENTEVFENTIKDNLESGIFLQGPQTGNTIHFNRIIPAAHKSAIRNDNPFQVSAEYNWYGYNEQMAVEPLISGNVTFGPWMTLHINAGPPTTIAKGNTTQVTADLRTDSSGFYHDPSQPGEGAIPTTPVSFNFPLGTIPSGNTNLGQLQSALTAGQVPGTADVTATADQETQSTPITVGISAVTITKTDNTVNHRANVGDTIIYSISLQNAGPDQATSVIVNDILPDGLDFLWASDSGIYNTTTRNITWNLGTLNVGTKILKVNATVRAEMAGNTIAANMANETMAETPYNATGSSQSIYVPKAELSMTKTDNTTNHQANVGDNITYTIILQNTGPDQATNVVVTDILSNGLDFVWASDGGVYNATTRTITWTLATLNMGTKTLTFNATVNATAAGQTITNNATEKHPEYPQTSTTNNDNIYIKKATITMTKTDNTTNHQANVNETVIFTIAVSNSALNDDATNVIIKDTVPIGLDVDLTSIINGNYNAATREITWNAVNIPNGTNIIKTFQTVVNGAKAGDPSGIINTASETHKEYPNTSTASDQPIYVPKSDLYVDGTVSNTNPYIGDIIYINFKLGNKGPDTAQNVVFTIQVPEGMLYISGEKDNGTFTYDPATRTITWTLGDVIVGDPNFKLYVQVLQAGIFSFITRLTTDTYDPNIAISINIQTINAQTKPQTVSASTKTVGMQSTGLPLGVLILAMLAILGGFWTAKRK